MLILKKLCEEFQLKEYQVQSTINLIDEGNTIPFIARYRKEQTGSLSDVVLRELEERLVYLRNLEDRKNEVIRLIDEQGKLTESLRNEIVAAKVLQRVEDLYRPYKQKKKTRATEAKAKGLQPLADTLLAQETDIKNISDIAAQYINDLVPDEKEALQGAMDIIAEMVSDHADFREKIREIYLSDAVIVTEATDEEEKTVYEMYYKFSEAVNKIANHRVLAINRGEKEKRLKVSMQTPDDKIVAYLKSQLVKKNASSTSTYVEQATEDSYKRLIAPSVTREVRNILSEKAEEEAIKVFATNTKNLLLVPPVKDKNVLAVDPSFRTGCKLAVIDGIGKLLTYDTIYPNEPQNKVLESKKRIKELIKQYDIDIIAIIRKLKNTGCNRNATLLLHLHPV